MFRTVGDRPASWESLLPAEVLRLPEELEGWTHYWMTRCSSPRWLRTSTRCSGGRLFQVEVARLGSVSDHYRAPGWFTRNVFNQLVAFLTRQGISVLGSRVLAVKGRTSGEWRTTPVNLLTHDGRRYLVAPRGETQWVRNLRAAGTGELRVGRRTESFCGRELNDDAKVPVLRAYLKRWKAEVGIFFEGTGPDSSDEQIRAIAPKHPAFEVLPPK